MDERMNGRPFTFAWAVVGVLQRLAIGSCVEPGRRRGLPPTKLRVTTLETAAAVQVKATANVHLDLACLEHYYIFFSGSP